MPNRILYVEDDPHWRGLVSTWLKDAGYEVIAVHGAAEASLVSKEAELGLVILDLDLGGENGLMLMKALKRTHPVVPIVLYTGLEHTDEAVVRMKEQGACQYLHKSTREELLRAVKSIVGLDE